MIDWKEHDGGPQPVADDVWVEVVLARGPLPDRGLCDGPASYQNWPNTTQYRVINQHLIDAARLEGVRRALKAAGEVADAYDESAASAVLWLRAETIAEEADHD